MILIYNKLKKNSIAPVAIVGMAFRFPGDLSDEHSFWQALKEGRDAVGRLGHERWAVDELQHPKRSEPGRSITFSAGVLSRIEEFDADFFGISPREAEWLDPQQRLLLELAWEAMENGGQAPSRLAGANVAVYVGISAIDYGLRRLDDLSSLTAHMMTGNTLSMAANRLSYVYDLRGPSAAMDTACSSSLVALHHACDSLRSGESSVALVGGVNLLLHPYPFIGFTKASMLSASGRCRAFDASADGYVRAEGGAVMLLKPMDRALADGDDIQAVILATGVNADGRRKTGITIPSCDGQTELMQSVLQRSGLSPLDVDYIEAHGTGTKVGDPIEAAAIGNVYGRCRPRSRPLPIGSVKTNLGHLEAASGMAGLVKAVLALKNRAVPPSLHLVTPNPNIDFAGLNLEVVTAYRPLTNSDRRPLVAGVNSFGFGGTNAHVLLQEYRAKRKPRRRSKLPAPPLFLSARTAQALRETAGRYAELLKQTTDGNFYDIAYAAAFRRQRLEARLAIRAADAEEAADRLTRFAQGETVAQVVLEDRLAQSGEVAFIYSGNGAQWVGMGRRLLAESPRFADLVTALDAPIHALAGFSIRQELHADESTSRLGDTGIAQPLLFAIQVALTTMLREQGIEAAAVAGHSVGEVTAAWAAGVLELDQAVEVICARSAAQAQTRGAGRMAAVGLTEAAMHEVLAAERCSDVEIAGINSPNNITLSGSLHDLERLRQILEPRGVFFRLLDLDYAFHSRHMDSIKDRLADRLVNLTPQPSSAITFVSTVTGDVLEGTTLDARYWWRNVRQPVRFAQAISTLITKGCRIFIEIGPHAILQRYMIECLSASGVTGRVLPTLRRDDDGLSRIEETALRVHLLCDSTRLGALFPEPGRHIRLPTYPWQRTRHWYSKTSESYALIERRRVHPLLGWRLKETDAAWGNTIDLETHPWLADHKVGGAVVLPGSAYVEMALAAAREWFGGECFELEELDILAPVVFDGEHARSLWFDLSPRDGSFHIRSRQRLSEDEWTLNAVGRLLGALAIPEPDNPAPGVAGEEFVIERETHYRLAAALRLEYGLAFQGLERACVQGQTLHATLAVPEVVKGAESDYVLHPVLLDVCFQSLVDFFRADIEAGHGVPLLPVKVGRVRYHRKAPVARFRAHLVRRSARSVLVDFELLDASGHILATLSGCRFRAATFHRKNAAVPACWKIEPRLTPHPIEQHHTSLPSSSELAKQVRAWFVVEEERLARVAYFKGALPLFEALTISFAHAAFHELFSSAGEWLQRTLAEPNTFTGEHRPFFRWLVRCLRQQGLLVEEAGTWRLEAAAIPPAEDIWRTIVREYPACLPELVLAGSVGLHLPALLAGATDPQALAESLRRSPVSKSLCDESPAYLGTRLAAQQILRNLAVAWPANRRLRVLEIAGGASDLDRHLADTFPEDRIDYVLAVSEEETRLRLQAEYAGHPFVIIAGVEGDDLKLSTEARLPELFDVVLIRHWLHRTRNPRVALGAARRKLAIGGLLILAEQHPDLSADFMHGHDPLWWHEMGSAEPVSGLRPPVAWEHALEEHGFEDVQTFFEPACEDLTAGSYLLLAKRPRKETLPVPEPAAETWLLLWDAHGPARLLGDLLCRRLESQGQRVAVAIAGDERSGEDSPAFDPQNRESVRHVLTAARRALGRIDHVVYLGLSGDDSQMIVENGAWLDSTCCPGLLHLVQALEDPSVGQPRLWLVTSGGALASSGMPDGWKANPLQASLWSFGRVIMNEYPALSCTLIDAACDPDSPEMVRRLEQEFLMPDGEREIVLTPQTRHSLRMGPVDPLARPSVRGTMPRFRLDFLVPGQLRNLVWLPQPERPLAEDEVEVRSVAAGLNFRDIMYTMGLLPDEAVENGFAGASLGLEFAGVVTRAGTRVHEFSPGDAVMGFGSACLASHVVTKATTITLKPVDWSFEAAATVPTVFLTAYYALKHLADLQPGERVLIHGAAGGVGIAAVQLARHLGADVFATAGSEEKRDFIRLLGADHVLDSRSLAFADHILDLTHGEGVDVVLNSLAGEAIRRNLRVLKPFGRFLELGKRDFIENTTIGLRPFKNNISYFGIDVDQLLIARPALAVKLFRDVMTLFLNGTLGPLPYRAVPVERVVEAFRTLQQARHIGKVVVTFDDARIRVDAPRPVVPPMRFKQDATYLVTGGLSGFGLESARWLAEHGAGHLVLLGRRGSQTPRATAAVRELETHGASVEIVACDVSDRAALQSVLTKIQRERPPLRGILHAAMVIDDALITNLDAERFRKVLAPKILGAWHLHNLTLGIPLDHFILYSSVTTFIGNPGQANYVAANAYLEGLATLRRSVGLPVTCIGWGPIGDAGYLTRNEAVKDSLTALLGAAPLTAKNALGMLEHLLVRDTGTLAVADFDWHAVARLLLSAEGPRFERLRREAGKAAGADEQGKDFAALIRGKSPEEVRSIVQTLVTQEVAQILGIGTDRIDPARSLHDLGMDSLMGVELALGLEKRFDIQLPAMMLNEGPTTERVSARIVEKIMRTQGQGDADEGHRLETLVDTLAAQHGEVVSTEEVAHTVAETQEQARAGMRLTS